MSNLEIVGWVIFIYWFVGFFKFGIKYVNGELDAKGCLSGTVFQMLEIALLLPWIWPFRKKGK